MGGGARHACCRFSSTHALFHACFMPHPWRQHAAPMPRPCPARACTAFGRGLSSGASLSPPASRRRLRRGSRRRGGPRQKTGAGGAASLHLGPRQAAMRAAGRRAWPAPAPGRPRRLEARCRQARRTQRRKQGPGAAAQVERGLTVLLHIEQLLGQRRRLRRVVQAASRPGAADELHDVVVAQPAQQADLHRCWAPHKMKAAPSGLASMSQLGAMPLRAPAGCRAGRRRGARAGRQRGAAAMGGGEVPARRRGCDGTGRAAGRAGSRPLTRLLHKQLHLLPILQQLLCVVRGRRQRGGRCAIVTRRHGGMLCCARAHTQMRCSHPRPPLAAATNASSPAAES